MAIKMTTTQGPQQAAMPDLQRLGALEVGARRSDITADLLRKMAEGGVPVRSNLHGASNVLLAGLGAYKNYQGEQKELEHRNALIEALGGQSGLDPLEAAMFASGDRSAINTILQGRLADRRLLDQRAHEAKTIAEQRSYDERLANEKRDQALRDAETAHKRDLEKQTEKAHLDAQRDALKGGKPVDLKDKYAETLMETGEQVQFLKSLAETYQPSFSSMGGGSEYAAAAQRFVGTNLPWFASENTEKAAIFWQGYKRFSELVERHGLFGAALTATESAQWSQADVNPAKSDRANTENFNKRMMILRNKAQQQINFKLSQNVPPEQISAALGFDINNLDAMFPQFPVPEDGASKKKTPQTHGRGGGQAPTGGTTKTINGATYYQGPDGGWYDNPEFK